MTNAKQLCERKKKSREDSCDHPLSSQPEGVSSVQKKTKKAKKKSKNDPIMNNEEIEISRNIEDGSGQQDKEAKSKKAKKRKRDDCEVRESEGDAKKKLKLDTGSRCTGDISEMSHSVIENGKKLKKKKKSASLSTGDGTEEKIDDSSVHVSVSDVPGSTISDDVEKSKKKKKGKKKKKSASSSLDNTEEKIDDDDDVANTSNDGDKKSKKKKKKKRKAEDEVEKPSRPASELAREYLNLWKNDRKQWHFQKVRQVWLLQNMYSNLISESDFTTLLDYLSGMKGQSRLKTVEQAERIMKDDDDAEDSDSSSAVVDVKVARARQIIQLLS